MAIEDFLVPGIAEEIAAAYPTLEQAGQQGFQFNFVNEQKKIQVTDQSKFPERVAMLGKAIMSPEFLADLEFITGIPNLLSDEAYSGGGMHLTGPGGRLDVHVDFNKLNDRKLFRRLNILLYLNPVWQEDWGGHIELWDKEVKTCHFRSSPKLNRCLIFETSDVSYHGVAPVSASAPHVRQSFAAYYYTREPPPGMTASHSTIFKARPNERLRGLVYMPAERLWRRVQKTIGDVKAMIRSR